MKSECRQQETEYLMQAKGGLTKGEFNRDTAL